MVSHLGDQTISESLDAFQAQFWPSVKGDEKALAAFLKGWKAFEKNMGDCVAILQVETLQRVYNFSEMVASVVQGLAEALSLSDAIYDDVPKLLEDMADPSSPEKGTSPPYMKVAFGWLVANIHDPYPSAVVRDSLAAETSSRRKDIDNWFLDVRKRIGWNGMRRKYFDNKRVQIVDAAKRFFLNADPFRPLPKVVESEFASIQIRVNDMYSGKFEESPLAIQLDRSAIDLSTDIKASARGLNTRKARKSSTTNAAHNYPTPHPSPTGISSPWALSPTPSLLDLPNTSKRGASLLSEGEDEDTRPSKRQRSSADVGAAFYTSTPSFSEMLSAISNGAATISPKCHEGGDVCTSSDRRPSPPCQLSRTSTCASPETSLPSPVASAFDTFETHPPPRPTATPSTLLKRKRRLSAPGETLPYSKRPQTPRFRPQAGINPPSVTQHAAGDEFRWDQLLDFSQLPPPVSDLTTEITGPVDVSLFDFCVWNEYDTSSMSQGTTTMSSSTTVDVDVTGGFAVQSNNLLAHNNLLFDWNPYSSSCSPQQLPTSDNSIFDFNGVPCEFTHLGTQLTTPLSLPTSHGCLPTFHMPLQPALQTVPMPAEEAARTVHESTLKAKAEQLHALQAQVAALAAEIAAAS